MAPRGPRRAALYVRISRDRPTEVSTQVQERDGRAYAGLKEWSVVEVYSDIGLSASKKEVIRPGYLQMIKDARAGAFDVLIIWKLDRLGRSVIELARVAEILQRHHVALVSVNDSIDTSSPGGRFVFTVLSALAQMESEQISMRVTAANAYRAAQGKPQGGGTRTFGYATGGMEVIPEEAALILEAAERVLAGEGTTAIARDWNARRVPLSHGGKKWYPARIGSILLNRHVSGQRVYRDTVMEGTWPAIITPELREEILLSVSDPDHRRKGHYRKALLNGLIVCGREGCGAKMVRMRRGDEDRYGCRNDGFTPGCGKTFITGDRVDAEVRDRVLLLLSESPGLRTAGDHGDLADLQAQVAVLRDRRILLTREFAAGRIDPDEWAAARRELSSTLEPLELQVLAAERAVRPDLPDLPTDLPGLEAWWDSEDTPLDEKRALLRALILKVEITPPVRRGAGAVEERVRVHWAV